MRVPADEVSLIAEVARTLETFNLQLQLSSVSIAGSWEERARAWTALCDLAAAGLTKCVATHGVLPDAAQVLAREIQLKFYDAPEIT